MTHKGDWQEGFAAKQAGGRIEENKVALTYNLIFGCSGHTKEESYRLARIYIGIMSTNDPTAIRKGQNWLFAIIGN